MFKNRNFDDFVPESNRKPILALQKPLWGVKCFFMTEVLYLQSYCFLKYSVLPLSMTARRTTRRNPIKDDSRYFANLNYYNLVSSNSSR